MSKPTMEEVGDVLGRNIHGLSRANDNLDGIMSIVREWAHNEENAAVRAAAALLNHSLQVPRGTYTTVLEHFNTTASRIQEK